MSDALTRIRKHAERWEKRAADLAEKASMTDYGPERALRYTQVDTLRACAKDIQRVLVRYGNDTRTFEKIREIAHDGSKSSVTSILDSQKALEETK